MHVLKLYIGCLSNLYSLWRDAQAGITPKEAKPDHTVKLKVAVDCMAPAASVIQEAGHRQL